MRRGSRPATHLTPSQRTAIQTAAMRLRPDRQYGFVLRCEDKLAVRGPSISDALVADIIRNVLKEHRP